MVKKINILSTKKLAQNQLKENQNFSLIEENFIETNLLDFDLTTLNENLIFTSKNAVESVLQHPKSNELKVKNVFSVGIKTKEFLEENGFNVIAYTDYASDLAEIISLVYNKESYTFFCGNLRLDFLTKTLKENNINFNEIEVYMTSLTPKKITQKVNGILFFSPSAVESYYKMNTVKEEVCFCIGETTSEVLVTKLRDKKVKNIIIAEKPSVENVINEVIEYFKN